MITEEKLKKTLTPIIPINEELVEVRKRKRKKKMVSNDRLIKDDIISSLYN